MSDQWVRVEDELPEDNRLVWVVTNDERDAVTPAVCDRKWDGYTAPWRNATCGMDLAGVWGAVTHWRYADVPDGPREKRA